MKSKGSGIFWVVKKEEKDFMFLILASKNVLISPFGLFLLPHRTPIEAKSLDKNK